MRKSVRFKLFAFLCAIICLFVFFSFLLNTLFLERYYERTKDASLVKIFTDIKNTYNGNINELSQNLEKDENLHQVRILIADRDFKTIYSSPVSIKRLSDKQKGGSARDALSGNIQSKVSKFTEKPTIEKRNDQRLNAYFINLYGKITVKSEPVYVMIMTPTAAISDSAGIANRFYLLTGILTLIIGSVLIFFISRRITKPIIEINAVAKKLSHLEFSYKIKTKSKDEIGELGESINHLSEKLEKSIYSLQQANEKLQDDIREKNKIEQMRKEFISNVSHELKTPLTLIMGYAEGLRLNVNEKEKDYYCEVISDEANKMNRLVMKLLDLAQLESGFVKISKIDFNILRCIDDNLEKSKILLDEKKAVISVSSPADCMVNADYDLTDQVFGNILSNAINHVNREGTIRISITKSSNKAVVSVFNTGRQIPPESIDKIWGSFYKVDKARTREYGGSGLGLTIVKTILDKENNSCGVRNLSGGVEFWFETDLAG